MKKTFAERVNQYKDSNTDEKKLNSFFDNVITQYKDDIELTERENKILEEKIEEIKESKKDFVFNIDISSLNDVDSRNQYANQYGQSLIDFELSKIQPLSNKLSENNNRIKLLNELIKFLMEVEP